MARDRQRAKQRRRASRAARGPDSGRAATACRASADDAEPDDSRLPAAGRAVEPVDGELVDGRRRTIELVERRRRASSRAADELDPAVTEEPRRARAAPRRRGARSGLHLPAATSSTSSSASSGRTAVRSARPPPSSLGFVVIAGGYLGLLDAIWKPLDRRHPLAPDSRNHVSLVRRQHLFRAREQGQAEPRAPRRPRWTRSAPCARSSCRPRPCQEMKDNQKVSVEKRTMPGYVLVNMDLNEDSWQLVKGTPGRHRLRRRLQRAGPADPGRGRPPAAPRGRAEGRAEPRPVLDRRVGQGHLRPAVGLLRRDLRDQRGRGASSRCWCPSSAARPRSRSASTR